MAKPQEEAPKQIDVASVMVSRPQISLPPNAEELLRRYAAGERSFTGARLAGARLNGANLQDINLENADLEDADLQDADLEGTRLVGANLRHADLRRANLLASNLERANMRGANLEQACLNSANLRDANLERSNIRSANLEHAKCGGVNLTSASLAGANLRGADLGRAYLSEADLTEANLERASFRDAILRSAILKRANLRRADLGGANLQHAQLVEAFLQGVIAGRAFLQDANLTGAELEHARLDGAHLLGAELSGGNLQSACLEQAILTGANLTGANLESANLVGAHLEHATVTSAKLDGVVMGYTYLVDVHLGPLCSAYATIRHNAPSFVDASSIVLSIDEPNLKNFLAQAGVPEFFVLYMVENARGLGREPAKALRSTFISYGKPDEPFARRLYEGLHRNGVVSFFFPEHATPGQKLHRVMRAKVNEYDSVLVVCSAASLERVGVRYEVEQALAREHRQGGEPCIIPIALDDYMFTEWVPSDPDTALALRERVVADFRGIAADASKFQGAFLKLLSALKK